MDVHTHLLRIARVAQKLGHFVAKVVAIPRNQISIVVVHPEACALRIDPGQPLALALRRVANHHRLHCLTSTLGAVSCFFCPSLRAYRASRM